MGNDAAMADDGAGLLRRLRRRKGWFILSFTVLLGLLVSTITVLPRTYRANAEVMVAGNEALVGGGSAGDAMRLGDPADLESQVLMLRSPRLMARLLQDPKVVAALVEDCEVSRARSLTAPIRARFEELVPCTELAANETTAMGRLEGGFAIGPVGRSRVIEVAFSSRVPEVATVIANALVDAYLADDRARKADTRGAAITWLQGEVTRAGEDLRRAEIAAEQYRREHGIVRGQIASIASERLSWQGQQLAAAEAAYALANARVQQFNGNAGELREVLDNRIIADLKQQLSQVSAKYSQMSARLGGRHPDLAEIAREQQNLQRRLDQEYRNIGGSLVRDRDAAKQRVTDLTAELEQLKGGVSNAAGAEAAMATIVRDVDVSRELFTHLSRKVSELEVERRLLPGDARLVHYAVVPQKPWFPKPAPFLAAGGAMALMLSAMVALLRDRADRTVRADSGLAQLSGVPVIGRIPRAAGRLARGGVTLEQIGRPSAFQESIRALFAQCVLLRGSAPQVLLVTSTGPGEGKTFLTLSMAHFAASTGRRVLAVECDLRRPSFGNTLNVPAGPGLTDYLRGEASFDAIVTHASSGAIDSILAGRPAIDSTELLSTGRIGELLRQARERYDLILIDSPPSQVLMDARLLARQVDGTIYCVSWGRSRTEGVLDGMRGIEEAGGRILGLAVGMVRPREYPLYEPHTALALPGRVAT